MRHLLCIGCSVADVGALGGILTLLDERERMMVLTGHI